MSITPRESIIAESARRIVVHMPDELTDTHIWDVICSLSKTKKQADYFRYVLPSKNAGQRLINDVRKRVDHKLKYPSPLDTMIDGLMNTLDDLVSQLGRPIK